MKSIILGILIATSAGAADLRPQIPGAPITAEPEMASPDTNANGPAGGIAIFLGILAVTRRRRA